MTRPADLLTHAGPALLLDAVLEAGAAGASATVTIRDNHRFMRPGFGVPAHVAIEWMAQTCGLFSGQEAAAAGHPIRLGMLLGTRNFRASHPWFSCGERLVVRAVLVLRDEGMGIFDCSVHDDPGAERARAQLTTYQRLGGNP